MKETDYDLVSPLGLDEEEENNIIKTSKKDSRSQNIESNNTKKNFDKIIIPYNFKKNIYTIPDNEIDGYENKEFLLNTLYSYNNQKLFKFDSRYRPNCCERIIFLFLFLIIILIILYGLSFLLIMFLFNPLVLYFSYKFLSIVFYGMKAYKKHLYEKLKIKAIKKKLAQTNKSKYCKEHNIRWKMGVSRYWLEIEKINN